MAEHIDYNTTLLSSGGHLWRWADQPTAEKRLRATGADGEVRMVLSRGAVRGQIVGMLTATGVDRAAADAALTSLEETLESLIDAGEAVAAEDDQGHRIADLSIDAYSRLVTDAVRGGARAYATGPGGVKVMQRYRLAVTNLSGRWS